MTLSQSSPCKVNLLLNTLGKRPDGFTELETLFFPVPLFDELQLTTGGPPGIRLTCSHPELPTDHTNLVHRAASAFLNSTAIRDGVQLHLEKRLPLAAGIGAGSANAAHTLLLLNQAYGHPLAHPQLDALAAALGSDVNFFLQPNPAIGLGRGERIEPLSPFQAFRGMALLLFHPGFGISTPWAFKELSTQFPDALNGKPGRAHALAKALQAPSPQTSGVQLYNALELPALKKYPILRLYQEFLREHGAWATLMSGSGSTTFGIFENLAQAQATTDGFRATFGNEGWLQVVQLG